MFFFWSYPTVMVLEDRSRTIDSDRNYIGHLSLPSNP
jgi:hypothetical protein